MLCSATDFATARKLASSDTLNVTIALSGVEMPDRYRERLVGGAIDALAAHDAKRQSVSVVSRYRRNSVQSVDRVSPAAIVPVFLNRTY